MTDEEARYDRIAEGYARWWSPVHRPATLALLDEIEPAVAAGATRVLDIGCGTGALAAAAVRRWPDVRVTGVDASAGMLAVAARELGALDASIRDRVSLVQATADQLPFDDGGFDIVVTAFVLQLVPSRYRALREARRVLGRDGTLAQATWLAGGSFPADDAYADALVAAGLEPRDGGGAHDEPRSPAAAAAQLRRAGFSGVTARRGRGGPPVHTGGLPRVPRLLRRRGAVRHPGARGSRGARGGPPGTPARAPGRGHADAAADRGRDGAALNATLTVSRACGRSSAVTTGPADGPVRGPAARRDDQPSAAVGLGGTLGASTASAAPSGGASATTASSTRGARTRAMTSFASAWIVTPSGASRSATVIVLS